MEADSLLFDGVSVGTTIKRHGEALAGRYKELNNKQKHVAGLCLNSIIDLSDEIRRFTAQVFQWRRMGHDEKQVPVQHQAQQASVQATF